MGYLRKLLPPYYKYSVFLFLGFMFLYCACVLAISEAYYKSASQILPIAYKMFDDTVNKSAPDFDWTTAEKEQLEDYRHVMMMLWVVSTVGVILSMLIILPQFFDFNDKRGNPSHLCLVQVKMAWILWYAVLAFVVVLGATVFWAWKISAPAVSSFHEHINKCEKEEVFVKELEVTFDCTKDDDKEVAAEHLCWQKVLTSMIAPLWVDILFYTFIAGHVLAFVAIPFFNKQLIKPDEDELEFMREEKKSLSEVKKSVNV